jgi:hypothetical protein
MSKLQNRRSQEDRRLPCTAKRMPSSSEKYASDRWYLLMRSHSCQELSEGAGILAVAVDAWDAKMRRRARLEVHGNFLPLKRY